MSSPKIVTHAGLTVNLAELKCIKMIKSDLNLKKYFLTFEFKTRYDYILNPNTKEFEKQEYNDTAAIEFNDWEYASAHQSEWEDIWQDYIVEGKTK